MKLKVASMIVLSGLSFSVAAHANEVLLTANQPMKVAFRLAHKNQNSQPIFGEVQTIALNQKMSIPVPLDNFDRAGIMIVSVNGHSLPASANQFDKPAQCSMTTDKTKTTGELTFTLNNPKSISCHSEGGVFG